MSQLSRRSLIGTCGMVAASAALSASGAAPADAPPGQKVRLLVAGAHPGDPEAGCGGAMARYAREGHEVTALHLTRGQAGISGKTHEQAADIRTAEAVAACKILNARPLFAAQMDGATEVDAAASAEFTQLIDGANPDVVLTQWPIDTHADHRACASLTLGAWLKLGRKFALYFYEVDLGSDTQCFRPTHYVDISATEALKRQACMAHQSQNPQGFYSRDHVPMMRFRGMESGHSMAEAFIHHDQSPPGWL